MPFNKEQVLPGGAAIRLHQTGHILGAASIELDWAGTNIVFSGDLGRYDDATMVDPVPVERADYLLVESTYGNRRHDRRDPADALAEIISETVGRGGTVVIPAFAVGRAQSLLFHLHQLKSRGRLANVPVFLDSPMAVDASEIFCRRVKDHKLPEARVPQCLRRCSVHPQCRRIKGADRQSHAEGDHFRKRNGNRRPRLASSQGLCCRTTRARSCLPAFRPAEPAVPQWWSGAETSRSTANTCRSERRSAISTCSPLTPMRMKSCDGSRLQSSAAK